MSLTHTTKRGRRYPYYLCRTARLQGWTACPTMSVAAHEIERLVVDQVRGIGKDKRLFKQVLDAARGQDASVDEADLRRALALFDPVWDALHAKEQASVLALLTEQGVYDGKAGTVEFTFQPLGIRALAREVEE